MNAVQECNSPSHDPTTTTSNQQKLNGDIHGANATVLVFKILYDERSPMNDLIAGTGTERVQVSSP